MVKVAGFGFHANCGGQRFHTGLDRQALRFKPVWFIKHCFSVSTLASSFSELEVPIVTSKIPKP